MGTKPTLSRFIFVAQSKMLSSCEQQVMSVFISSWQRIEILLVRRDDKRAGLFKLASPAHGRALGRAGQTALRAGLAKQVLRNLEASTCLCRSEQKVLDRLLESLF